MGSTPEIITLQFGNYTNYVGTHLWNIQEAQFNYDPLAEPSDINHDVLFREGKTFKGDVTFTPRVLICDLKGSYTNFPQEGELYAGPVSSVDQIRSDIAWDESKIEILDEEEKSKKTKNDFHQDLEKPEADPESKEYNFAENVTEWSDFMYSRHHPRSVNIIKEYQHETSETSFDTFAAGEELWKHFEDDFGDKIRNILEECDFCQGFQVLFDVFDGFSGLATKCGEHLNDEYGKTLFCVPIFAPTAREFKNCDDPMSDSIRLMNIALTFSQLSESSAFFIPLSTMSRVWRAIEQPRAFQNLDYHPENYYQTASILATYLDTLSLRYRLRYPSGGSYLSHLCTDMNRYGRKMGAAGLAMPFKMGAEEDLIEYLDRVEGPLFDNLSPHCEPGTDRVLQSICMRGIPETRLKKPREKAGKQVQMAAYKCSSVGEMIQLYYQCSYYSSFAHVTSIEDPMKLRQPFPREILSKNLSRNGFSLPEMPENPSRIESMPVMATVQVSSALSNTLEALHRDTKRIKFAKIHRFKESGMENDEYEESLERLLSFKENYDEGFEL
ncbi:protein misato [Culicoides brevitarsis]|uniref:protein misato n=1 Tax=Culicoides brevitarsis TaxID=469753 RepID=UPI00307B34A4